MNIFTFCLKLLVPLLLATKGIMVWTKAIEKRATILQNLGIVMNDDPLSNPEGRSRRQLVFLAIVSLWTVFSMLLLKIAPYVCATLNLLVGLVALTFTVIIIICKDGYQAQGALGLSLPFAFWFAVSIIVFAIPPLHVFYSLPIYAAVLLVVGILAEICIIRTRRFEATYRKQEGEEVSSDSKGVKKDE